MQENRENIILFPKWKTTLEKESLLALEQSQYEVALKKLNKLISFRINDHEIVFGKLICLMELERYEEAQDLCEQLLLYSNENYYHYVHVYLTILFQTSQYDSVMEQIENEFMNEEIPKLIKEQFQQLYDMSEQMKQEIINRESVEFIKELYDSIHNEDYVRQWRLIENLRKMKVNPPEEIMDLLVEEHIHPVIKTVIFKWLQDIEMNESIEIHKFNKQIKVNPLEVTTIREHTITKQTMLLVSELEQKNPSLYILLAQLLYRYIYVRYPIVPISKEVINIAESLIIIGERYLHIENDTIHNEEIEKYIKEIQMCETLYLSIIEE